MREYLAVAALSVGVILLAVRLVSKRHHCEKVVMLFLFMLIFMCVIDWQITAGVTQQVRIFWGIAVVLGGIALAYDATSAKTYYYLKDFQVRDDLHREALEGLLHTFRLEHLPREATLKMDYRLLTMENVSPAEEKACLRLINTYINDHDCSDIKDWRFMIIFASTLQLLAVAAATIFHIWQG